MARARLIIICLILIIGQRQSSAIEAEQDSPRSDPVLDILNKLTTAASDDENAAIVEIGDGPDFRSRADGEWTLATEEIGPASCATNQIQIGDPERRVIRQDDDEPASASPIRFVATHSKQASENASGASARRRSLGSIETQISKQAKRAPCADDPESQTRAIFMDESDADSIVSVSAARRAPLQQEDLPRYESGLGMDSEAVEIVADMLLSERQALSSQSSSVEKLAPSDKSSVEAAPERSEIQVVKKQLASDMKALIETINAQNKSQKGKKNEPIDPEAAFKALIAQVELDRKKRELLLAERSIEKETSSKPPRIHARSPRAALAIDALFKDASLGGITCRIIDADTRQLVPARVRITDVTDIAARAPLPTGAWCDGVFSADVISGPVKVEVNRGRFSSSYLKCLEIKPGQTAIQDVVIGRPRALDFAANGWHLADFDISLRLRSGERSLWFGDAPTLADLVLAARASGVQILGAPITSGQEDYCLQALQAAQSSDILLLSVFPGPRHLFNGCALGLGLKTWQGLSQELSAPEAPLRDMFEDIHARGGLAVFNHLSGLERKALRKDIFALFPRLRKENFYPDTAAAIRLYAANELPFDTVVGPAFDLIALDGTEASERVWFNLLNNGYNVGAIGSGGGSLEGGRLPFGQTFVHIAGKPSRENTLEALKNGGTSISFGPAVFCKIFERDMGPGSVLPTDGRSLTLQIQAYASMSSGAHLEKIDVLRNGEVIQTQIPNEGETQIHDLRFPISEKATAWYMARVTERIDGPIRRMAWTSPIFFRNSLYALAEPIKARVNGNLQCLLSPAQGSVTALVPGQPPRLIATDGMGRFKVELPASGALIFESPGCEPLTRRIFEHPKIQKALAALQSEQSGTIMEQLANPAIFARWKLLLSDLEWNISLAPASK